MSLELLFPQGRLAKVLMGEPTDVAARHISNRPSGGEPFVTIEITDDEATLTAYLTESLAIRLCGLLSAFKLEWPVDFPMGVDPVAAIEPEKSMPPKPPMTPEKMPIIRRHDGHWIEPTDAEAGERIGPYSTVAEAEQDRRDVLRFLNRLNDGEK